MELTKRLPESLVPRAVTLAFNHKVKYAGTSGVNIEKLDARESIVSIKNKSFVQNHIGGVHACRRNLFSGPDFNFRCDRPDSRNGDRNGEVILAALDDVDWFRYFRCMFQTRTFLSSNR